ncbi:MAG: hypothetical protein ACLQNV_02545 [Steroidobacteraceae bacterium]
MTIDSSIRRMPAYLIRPCGKMPKSSKKKQALVTLVIGDNYSRLFNYVSRSGFELYAAKISAELIVIDRPLDTSRRANGRSPAWQKCLILDDPTVSQFEQIAWIDSDIVINPNSPSIFSGVPVTHIAAVDSYAAPDPETHARRLRRSYENWRRQGISFIDNETPESYFTQRGLPSHPKVMQTGVFVCSPDHHRWILRRAYKYEDPGHPSWNYEMGPLAHECASHSPMIWLDPRYNAMVSGAMQNLMASRVFEYLPRFADRYYRAVMRRTALSWIQIPAIRRIIAENYFTHFAGTQGLMEWL